MQSAAAIAFALVLISACRTTDAHFEDSVEGGLLVRVVDASGEPVAGAEVRAQGGPTQGASTKPLLILDPLFAGSVRRAEDYGSSWRTNSRGEVRVPSGGSNRHVVARDGDRFGAAHIGSTQSDELVIDLEHDESVRVRCVDADVRPAVGALVSVGASPPDDLEAGRYGEWLWSARVTAADGTLVIPHAQLWRARQREGWKVTVGGFVWWGAEMGGESIFPFPAIGDEPLVFTVSPHGFLDVRLPIASLPAGSEVWLRWLNPPPDPDDPDEVPEVSFGVSEGWNLAIPLGARFEAVLEVEGALDPRVQFDGPTRPGERVEVAIGPLQPAARVTGRLVDADGRPMAGRAFDAWLERGGERVEPEEDWLGTDDHGRFAFDLVPGSGGTLRVRVEPEFRLEGVFSERLVLGGEPREPEPSIEARHEFAGPLPAGEVALGDVVCDREP